MFYEGNGKLRTVTGIKDTTAPVSSNTYSNLNCTIDTCYLDDPYEGELFVWLTDLYSDWAALNYSSSERDLVWQFKRFPDESSTTVQVRLTANLAANYKVWSSILRVVLSPSNEVLPPHHHTVSSGTQMLISQWIGWWFSSHEQWKYLELPYLDSDINARVFRNGERARTIFSAMNQYPGLFASGIQNLVRIETVVECAAWSEWCDERRRKHTRLRECRRRAGNRVRASSKEWHCDAIWIVSRFLSKLYGGVSLVRQHAQGPENARYITDVSLTFGAEIKSINIIKGIFGSTEAVAINGTMISRTLSPSPVHLINTHINV